MIPPTQMRIFTEIAAERAQADAKYGGSVHDDTHTNFDWIVYITKHLGRAVQWPFQPSSFRRQMVRVAGLAVAAIEWVDRRYPAP